MTRISATNLPYQGTTSVVPPLASAAVGFSRCRPQPSGPKGLGDHRGHCVAARLKACPRVSTFAFTVGPQLITALSEGRGYGEAGGEGFFSSCQISESLSRL